VRDLLLAWRALRRAKAFSLSAVLTLALGIAGTTAMFALMQGVLLRPLAVREQDQLIVAWKDVASTAPGHWPFLLPDVDVIRDGSRLLERVAGVGYNGATPTIVIEGASASYIKTALVTGEFFDVLGIDPFLGRALTRADDVAGAEHVMVISYGLWQRRYAGSRDAIGRRLTINEQPFTIVGVMPPDVEFPRGAEAWRTIASFAATQANAAFRVDVDLIARMRRGVTVAQARDELRMLIVQTEQTSPPGSPRGLSPVVRSFEEAVVGDVRSPMLVLSGAVALVLLIAGANVANLLLLRGESRRGELAVRAALGASRGRLAREAIVESFVLAVVAGAVGLTVTWWTLHLLLAILPEGLPRLGSVRIDAAVVVFTIALAFMSAALAGLVPALWSARADVVSELRAGGRGATVGAARHGRRALVVTQVALAVTIVAAAGLLTRSLLRLQAVDLGLSADRLVFVQLELPQAKYATDRTRHVQFLHDIVAQLEAVPGIAAATPVNAWPFAGTAAWDALITGEGQAAEAAARNPLLNLEAVHPNYFETFQIPLVRGRSFTAADGQGAPNVAIVSEDVAARTWPGQAPVGKRIKLGRFDSTAAWRTVVGVAAPTRYRELTDPRPTLYLPSEQFIVSARTLVMRTDAPLALVASAARERVRHVDPDVQVVEIAPFAALLDAPLARPRFNAFLIGAFGVAALLLATVGLYAVMAAYVGQRSREIAVRMALGARASDVRRLVLGEGLRLAGLGAAIGVTGAIATTRLVRGMLFGVQPLDPASIVSAAVLLVAVAALACYLPMRRATRVDPVVTLRAN
jgi:putative ABC transport system permease protein